MNFILIKLKNKYQLYIAKEVKVLMFTVTNRTFDINLVLLVFLYSMNHLYFSSPCKALFMPCANCVALTDLSKKLSI